MFHMIKLTTKIATLFDLQAFKVPLMSRFSAQEVRNTSGKTPISYFDMLLGILYHAFHLVQCPRK